jgi:hypothetical protein
VALGKELGKAESAAMASELGKAQKAALGKELGKAERAALAVANQSEAAKAAKHMKAASTNHLQ